MQMTAGRHELERIGAENQRSQSGLDLRRHRPLQRHPPPNVKTLSGTARLQGLAGAGTRAFRTRCRGPQAASGWTPSFGRGLRQSWTRNRWNRTIRVLAGLTEGDRLVGIISHVGRPEGPHRPAGGGAQNPTGGSTGELVV